MKTILITAFILLIANMSFAQSHTFKQCRYNKEWANAKKDVENSAPSCPACINNDKQEKLARVAEDKRIADVKAAKAKAEKEAKDLAFAEEQKRKNEEAKKAQSGEVTISNPVSKIANAKKSKYEISEGVNYTCFTDSKGPFTKEYNLHFSQNKHNVKILRNQSIVFESNDYCRISPVHGKSLFVLMASSNASPCRANNGNNSILINEKGEKINIPNIDKFGIFFANRENENYFDIAVFTGSCTPVYNDKYANADWHTIIYTFNYENLELISTRKSWQHDDCACD